jgi:hypothetical protein
MMLERSPDATWGVLAPAFKGCEVSFARERFAHNGCTFLTDTGCELHGTGHQPLECRFCHHDRPDCGARCHDDIGLDWNTAAGRALVVRWSRVKGFLVRASFICRTGTGSQPRKGQVGNTASF